MSDDNLNERYPGNSYNKIALKSKDPGPEEKKLEKVTKGGVSIRKKNLGDKFKEAFLSADLPSVFDHIVFNVLVPSVKGAISDMVRGAIDTMFWGGRGAGPNDRDRSRGYVYTNYSRYYDDRNGRSPDRSAQDQQRQKPVDPVEGLVFTNMVDAEEVLSALIEQLRKFEVVSVRDLYSLAGVQTDYTKNNYGWFNLENSCVIRIREGYILKLPKPVVLN